jgi:hypothetical protein
MIIREINEFCRLKARLRCSWPLFEPFACFNRPAFIGQPADKATPCPLHSHALPVIIAISFYLKSAQCVENWGCTASRAVCADLLDWTRSVDKPLPATQAGISRGPAGLTGH